MKRITNLTAVLGMLVLALLFNNCGRMGDLETKTLAMPSQSPSIAAPASTLVLPIAPSLLQANAVSAAQINLGWNDNSTNETGFKIERANFSGGPYSLLATVGPGTKSFSDLNLQGTTTYYYRIYAYNFIGASAYSNETNATTLVVPPPIAPTNLLSTGFSQSQIDLTWNDNSNDETGFQIERATSVTGPFSQIATVSAGITGFSDIGINSYARFFYRVYAIKGTISSAYSNVANAATLPPANISAFLTNIILISTGVRISTSGPVQQIRYFHDFSKGYINVVGQAPYPSSLDVPVSFPKGTSFICFQVAGTDGVFNGFEIGDPQLCIPVP
jgi:hypothetical protein